MDPDVFEQQRFLSFRVGFPGFLPTGTVAYLFEENELSRDGIAAAARRAISRKI